MTERERARQAEHRLAVLQHAEEVTHNVALTCRYYGISRHTFYNWRRRYEELGLAGLSDRSRRPHHCPHGRRQRSWARSSISARTTTSVPRRLRCTSSATTTSR